MYSRGKYINIWQKDQGMLGDWSTKDNSLFYNCLVLLLLFVFVCFFLVVSICFNFILAHSV